MGCCVEARVYIRVELGDYTPFYAVLDDMGFEVQEDGDPDECSRVAVDLVFVAGIADTSFIQVEKVTATRDDILPGYYIQQRVESCKEEFYESLRAEGFDTVEI
jgi:hypothetical protein